MTDDTQIVAGAESPAEQAPQSEADAAVKTDVQGQPEPDTARLGATLDDSDGDDAVDKPRKMSGSQRNKLRIAALQDEVASLHAKLASSPAGKREAPPKLDDFASWDEHQVALIEYAARNALKNADESQAKERIDVAEREVFQHALADHESRVSLAREKIQDYDKALNSYEGPPLSPENARLLIESDKSELLAHHLATRPELVRELNRLHSTSPVQAARRMGQIEARLSYPTAKTVSSAPPPVGAVKGAASPTVDPSKMSFKEYKAYREKGGTF